MYLYILKGKFYKISSELEGKMSFRFGNPFPEVWFPQQDERYAYHGRFVQRPEVNQITQILSNKNAVALTGIPNVGKTNIAVQYAHLKRTLYMEGGILFLNAKELEEDCNLFVQKYLPKAILQGSNAVLAWLLTQKNVLVVLDNVEESEMVHRFISDFVHAFMSANHLVVTSRVAIAQTENIPVGVLDERTGALVFLKRINTSLTALENASEKDQSAALDLARIVGGIPSKLVEAGAYVEDTGGSPTRFLQLVQSGRYLFTEEK